MSVDVYIRNTPWCRTCFSSQITNKFSQGLRPAKEECRPAKGAAKIPQHYGSLVIHYTDTPACLLLLHLLKSYIDSNENRSTAKWQSPIDFSGVEVVCVTVGRDSEHFASTCSQLDLAGVFAFKSESEQTRISSLVESFGFQFVCLDLNHLFSISSTSTSDASHTSSFLNLDDPNLPIQSKSQANHSSLPPPSLRSFIETLTPTSRLTVLTQLVFSQILQYCHRPSTNGKRVLLKSTTSTTMAIDTLVSVSLGSGWSLAEQIGGTSSTDDVFICRPLSQMVDAEVRYHLELNGLTWSSKDEEGQGSSSKMKTIPSLIAGFLTKLEEDYPMTSSVINKAASKIEHRTTMPTATNDQRPSLRICPTCRLPSDPRSNSWKKSITLASHSNQVISQPQDHQQIINLADHLCYSCLGTFRDGFQPLTQLTNQAQSWIPLPSYVSESVDQQGPNRGIRKYEELREMIEGYLIDSEVVDEV